MTVSPLAMQVSRAPAAVGSPHHPDKGMPLPMSHQPELALLQRTQGGRRVPSGGGWRPATAPADVTAAFKSQTTTSRFDPRRNARAADAPPAPGTPTQEARAVAKASAVPGTWGPVYTLRCDSPASPAPAPAPRTRTSSYAGTVSSWPCRG
jgi:hypothetical protein